MSGLSLDNIGLGALKEQFGIELQKVLENISDPNTDAKKARKVTISVTLKPNEKRNIAMMSLQAKCSLVPSGAIETEIYIDRDKNGEVIAEELHGQLPGQMKMEFPPNATATGDSKISIVK